MKDDDPEFYTTEEVARIARITPWTVRRMLRDTDTFPNAVRPGKVWLIPAEDLAAYLQENYGRREA